MTVGKINKQSRSSQDEKTRKRRGSGSENRKVIKNWKSESLNKGKDHSHQ